MDHRSPVVLLSSSDLTKRQRYCVLVASLSAVGRNNELANVLRKGIRRDKLPHTFFRELFVHLSLVLGFPRMLDGLEQIHRMIPRRQLKQSGSGSRKKGLEIFKSIYGDQTDKVLEKMRRLHPELPSWIVRDTYGRVFARKGLSLQERELLNVVVLALQGFDKQLYSHVRGAGRVGVKRESLKAAVASASRLTGIRLSGAMSMISNYTRESKRR